jgi:DNA polymerase-4
MFVKPRFEVYKAVSQQIREIFAEHTSIIEPLSLDEAYLDVIENLQSIPLARDVALAIRAKIKQETDLQLIRRNLLQQVSGQARLRSPQAERPVRHHAGNGPGVRRKPAGQQVSWHRADDQRQDELPRPLHRPRLRNQSLEFMLVNFGKAGAYYYWISRGVDNREIRADRVRKSVGAENTFSIDLSEFEMMVSELQTLRL